MVCAHVSTVTTLTILAVDHGKSTLTHALIQKAGVNASSGLSTHVRADEIARGISIKSTAVSMYFKCPEDAVTSIKQKTEGTPSRCCWSS